jgi:hypothetical protein
MFLAVQHLTVRAICSPTLRSGYCIQRHIMAEGYRTDTKAQADSSLWKEDSGNKTF